MPKFPQSPEPILAALASAFRRAGDERLLNLLEQSEAELEWISQDFNRDEYRLVLSVPHDVHASVEEHLDGIEATLQDKALRITRGCSDGDVREVRVLPTLTAPEGWRRGARTLAVSDQDADRIWKPGWFRLFLSHVSLHKAQVSMLKTYLERYHVSAFVAHEDIQPSREWQGEIERGLASCHAIAALVTPEFHDSIWCMQEVGWGLGRGVLVQPVLLPSDPRGFYAFRQGIRGDLKLPAPLAAGLVKVLGRHHACSQPMIEALTSAMEGAYSWDMSRAVAGVIRDLPGFSEDQIRRLLKSIDTNHEVRTGNNVPETIRELATKNNVGFVAATPSADEYDPFAGE